MTLDRLYDKYRAFVEDTSAEKTRTMSYVTFLRYMHSYHVDVAIKRAKEDECDTCIRLSVALENKNLTADERMLLEKQQQMHADDARTQRVALKEAVKVCYCITTE